MKFLTVDASKSINPNTGEMWYRAEVGVSLEENENPDEAFQTLKNKLDGWLPNPFENMVTIAPKGDIFFNVSKNREERI